MVTSLEFGVRSLGVEFVGFQRRVCEGLRGRVGKIGCTGCALGGKFPELMTFFRDQGLLESVVFLRGSLELELELELDGTVVVGWGNSSFADLPDALLS